MFCTMDWSEVYSYLIFVRYSDNQCTCTTYVTMANYLYYQSSSIVSLVQHMKF